MTDRFRFADFVLDQPERVLARDGTPVELNARYFDALALMVREPGALVTKDRFLDEVWRGVPVTDEALTQCIKTLRRTLGDDAANPRLIATVPKHGYRFIAPVEADGATPAPPAPEPVAAAPALPLQGALVRAAAGTVGGGIAGMIGGLLYGFATAPVARDGSGGASTLLVLMSVTTLVALVGGAGVAGGIALAARVSGAPWRWAAAGGAAGGLVVGAIAKLLGLDAFALLLGQTPGDITGALEGAAIGATVGLAGWAAHRWGGAPARQLALAGVISAAGGAAVTLLGGRLMAGSLDLLTQAMPQSRLSLNRIGALFGETGLGPISQVVTGTLEAALFGLGVVSAMLLAARRA